MGSVRGSHCTFQYLPQCDATAKRKTHEPTLFTQCGRKQTGTTSIAEVREPGSERAMKKFTKGRENRNADIEQSEFITVQWDKLSLLRPIKQKRYVKVQKLVVCLIELHCKSSKLAVGLIEAPSSEKCNPALSSCGRR